MELLNTKSILECDTDEEILKHGKEMDTIIANIYNYRDYDCALVCKYQDEYHSKYKNKIYSCQISELFSEIERFDMKNGVDMYLDDDGYINLIIYGQGYTYKDNYHLIVMGVKVLPYDRDRKFIDLSMLIKEGDIPTISKQQFE